MQRQRRRRSKRIWYVLLGVFIAVFLFSFLVQRFKDDSEVDAASTAGLRDILFQIIRWVIIIR